MKQYTAPERGSAKKKEQAGPKTRHQEDKQQDWSQYIHRDQELCEILGLYLRLMRGEGKRSQRTTSSTRSNRQVQNQLITAHKGSQRHGKDMTTSILCPL